MTAVMCPGSFDPLHLGHVDVVRRCVERFERTVVAVVANPSKSPLFSIEERTGFIAAEFGDTVEVAAFDGLLVDFAGERGVDAVVKGLRTATDFEYERQMAQMNRHVAGVDTMFLASRPDHVFLSSSLIKEVARLGGDVSALVPQSVAKALKERYG